MYRVNFINAAGLEESFEYGAVEQIIARHRANHWLVLPCLGYLRRGREIRSG